MYGKMGTDPDCDSRLSEYILQHWQNIPSSGMSSSSVTGMVKRRDDELRYVDTRRGLAGLPVRDGLAGDVETLGELSLDHSAGLAVLLDGFTYRHGDSLRRMSRSLQHDSARGVKKRSAASGRVREQDPRCQIGISLTIERARIDVTSAVV